MYVLQDQVVNDVSSVVSGTHSTCPYHCLTSRHVIIIYMLHTCCIYMLKSET